MKSIIIKTLMFNLLLSYIASFTSFGVIVIGIVGIIGYYLVTIKLKTILSILRREELFVITLLFLIYIIFQQRLTVWDYKRPDNIKVLIYGLQHIVIFYVLIIYGMRSIRNALILTRSFAAILLISFSFFLIGGLFPEHIVPLWLSLYEKHVFEIENMGLSLSRLFAGLSYSLKNLGYQVSAGFVLFLSLFAIEKGNWKFLWGFGIVLGLVTIFILGERSVVAAVIVGSVFLGKTLLSNSLKISSILKMCFVLAAVVIVAVGIIGILFNLNIFSDHDLNLTDYFKSEAMLHRRFESKDIRVRIEMQRAAVSIIAEKPLGLFADGLAEEEWARIAINKGYRVVFDADNRTYALVHNGYLRLIMYFGWIMGIAMVYVLVYVLRGAKVLSRIKENRNIERRYAIPVVAGMLALLTQAIFHNDSLFTFERTTWVTFCLLIMWIKSLKRENIFHNSNS